MKETNGLLLLIIITIAVGIFCGTNEGTSVGGVVGIRFVSAFTSTPRLKNHRWSPAWNRFSRLIKERELSEVIEDYDFETKEKDEDMMISSRYSLLPEYNSGKLDRLFSRLDIDDMSRHNAGSVTAAAALVAGTTIGAGVLALPVLMAPAGFVAGSIGLLLAYIVMTVSGLLIAELTLNQFGRTGKPVGILSLYQEGLGQPFGAIGTAAYFFLHYAVMVAYVAQGGTNLSIVLPEGSSGQYVFCGGIASILALLSKNAMDSINNILVIGVFATFAAIVGIGVTTADFGSLIDPASQHPEQLFAAFPVILLAFVYQNIVPVIVKDLEGNRQKITQAIVWGTTTPLIMFLAWTAVILANGSTSTATSDPLAMLQGNNGLLSPLVSTFSVLALVTSMIGFAYGLMDAWTDVLKLKPEDTSSSSASRKALLYGLVFGPPLALSVANPDSFLTALEYGGAFGVSTLFLVLPSVLAWKDRYATSAPLLTRPIVPGKMPLIIIGALSGLLIVQQAADKLLPLIVQP